MKYKALIEENFEIDEADTGKMVPFIFRPVQKRYYEELCRDYDIENKGISVPIREDILKARKEGFTSLILGLFAADDILQENATETEVLSYKDDATKKFRRRYYNFIKSYFRKRWGVEDDNQIFDVCKLDSGEFVLRHNKNHFYCGTASARTGERGGTLHKLLFSEHAHYPDTGNLTAKEIIVGTTEQVAFNAGWVFKESTANGMGNFHHDEWWKAYRGESRFKGRFFSWQEFYTPEQFAIIESQAPDKATLRQEYPKTPEEAFIASGTPYFDNEKIFEIINSGIPQEPKYKGLLKMEGGAVRFYESNNKEDLNVLKIYEMPDSYSYYIAGGDVAEGKADGDYNTLYVINNRTAKVAATYRGQIRPDEYAELAYLVGNFYNTAYLAIEVNKDGFWVNNELVRKNYPNLYFQEVQDEVTKQLTKKFGWRTDSKTRPLMLAELQSLLAFRRDIWLDRTLLEECLTFVRNSVGRPEAINGKFDDMIMAAAIAYVVRPNVPQYVRPKPETEKTETEKLWEQVDKDLQMAASRDQNQKEFWEE